MGDSRNAKGEVLSGLTRKFYATSPPTAEAIAYAVNLAQNLHLQKVVFESDNMELIRNCRGEDVSGEIQHIVQDISFFRGNFVHSGFTWVHRHGNKVAHHLALLESRNSTPFYLAGDGIDLPPWRPCCRLIVQIALLNLCCTPLLFQSLVVMLVARWSMLHCL